MIQFRLTWLLLTPSLLSGSIVLVTTLIFIGLSTWGYISDSGLFYDYLFGPSGVVTVLLVAPDMSVFFRSAILSNPTTYNVLIFTAAVVIGFIVFEILEGSKRAAKESSALWYQLHSPSAGVREASKATLTRLGVRIAAFISWMIYTLAFITAMTPFCITLLTIGIDAIAEGAMWGWAYGIAAASLFAFCLHLHIIFARLTLLRPRIFGGLDIQMAALD
jgi:hypothetical protein